MFSKSEFLRRVFIHSSSDPQADSWQGQTDVSRWEDLTLPLLKEFRSHLSEVYWNTNRANADWYWGYKSVERLTQKSQWHSVVEHWEYLPKDKLKKFQSQLKAQVLLNAKRYSMFRAATFSLNGISVTRTDPIQTNEKLKPWIWDERETENLVKFLNQFMKPNPETAPTAPANDTPASKQEWRRFNQLKDMLSGANVKQESMSLPSESASTRKSASVHVTKSSPIVPEVKQSWREAVQRRRREAGAYMMRKLDFSNSGQNTQEEVEVDLPAIAEADSSSKP
jgi:hypothetical protein